MLAETGRVHYVGITDEEALDAFKALGKALEYSSGDFKNKDVVYTDDDGYVHFTSFGVTLNAAWKAAS